jgi:RecA-family ATPase
MDMNRANEARDMTKKLAALAEKYQCAIVLVGHMNKAAGNKAAYRGMGSIDFFAVARSVLLVGRVFKWQQNPTMFQDLPVHGTMPPDQHKHRVS